MMWKCSGTERRRRAAAGAERAHEAARAPPLYGLGATAAERVAAHGDAPLLVRVRVTVRVGVRVRVRVRVLGFGC